MFFQTDVSVVLNFVYIFVFVYQSVCHKVHKPLSEVFNSSSSKSLDKFDGKLSEQFN